MEDKTTKTILAEAGKGETVVVPKSQLKGLMDRIESLERGSKFEKPKRVTERVATLRFHKDKPVVWYGNVRELINKETQKLVAWMDIKLFKEDKALTVHYIDFLNSVGEYANNSVSVNVNNQTVEEVVASEGRHTTKNPDEAGITGRVWQEREVNIEVISRVYTAEVEVSDGEHQGEVFTIPSSCLNQ